MIYYRETAIHQTHQYKYLGNVIDPSLEPDGELSEQIQKSKWAAITSWKSSSIPDTKNSKVHLYHDNCTTFAVLFVTSSENDWHPKEIVEIHRKLSVQIDQWMSSSINRKLNQKEMLRFGEAMSKRRIVQPFQQLLWNEQSW